jgi:uncharacterized RDD family membrane protein YckC
MKYSSRQEFHRYKEYSLATVRRRFFAFLIDWLVLILLYVIIVLLFALSNMNIEKVNVHSMFDVDLEMTNTPAFFMSVMKIFLGVLPILYFSLMFFFWNGKTIGKSLLRIRAVSLYHEHLGLWHSIERSLGYFASALEFGLGYFQVFWNPNRMTLHDKIGETVVIYIPGRKKHR